MAKEKPGDVTAALNKLYSYGRTYPRGDGPPDGPNEGWQIRRDRASHRAIRNPTPNSKPFRIQRQARPRLRQRRSEKLAARLRETASKF